MLQIYTALPMPCSWLLQLARIIREESMSRQAKLFGAAFVVLALLASVQHAFAQGGVSGTTLSGVVVDAQGGIIPGATVVVKNNATAAESRTVTGSTGEFVVAGLVPGRYTVTVSLMGFKTFVAPDVQVVAATPLSLKAALQLGEFTEKVVVTGATDIVQTRSATVQTTLQASQLQQLPLSTHTALDYIVSLPGVNTSASGNTRGSTINGLPQRAMNITIDGINVHVHPADDGLGRGNHRLHLDAGGREHRLRRRADSHDDAERIEPIQRRDVQLLAQSGRHDGRRHVVAQQQAPLVLGPEHALLVQQARPAKDRGRRVFH
jgi:hypothetical protein